jgi:MoxR-like ATPase
MKMATHQAPRSSTRKDAEFLDRLDRLAKEAVRVYALADRVATLTGTHPTRDQYLKELHSRGPLEINSGTKSIEGRKAAQELPLFWNTIRSLVAAQFSGSALGSRKAIEAILKKFAPVDHGFWDFTKWSAPSKEGSRTWARAFSLLSLYSVALPRVSESLPDSASKVEAAAQDLVNQLAPFLILGSEDSSALLPAATVLKLVDRVLPDNRKDDTRPAPMASGTARNYTFQGLKEVCRLELLEKSLRTRLAVCLAEAETSAYDVALMVRALAGRYLNRSVLQIDPADNELYKRAVQYVLSSRNTNGTWKLDDGVIKSWKSEYSPLAFILDLPNAVLAPCREALADTVDEVLGALNRRLTGYELKLQHDKAFGEYTRVNYSIYDGLLVGAAVADRLRDLLSDAILDELGAEVPTQLLAWEGLPESLDFKKDLEDGAINLWRQRSERRPGAILLFGPPGTGKTTIAKSLLGALNSALRSAPGEGAREDWRFLALSPADFARQGSDKIIASAEELFRKLQRVRRCIVLLDEMEEFLRVRGPESSPQNRLITTAFLPLLQETVNKREIILIVATNFVGTIDSAVTRRGRFDLILPLGPPDRASRRIIIRTALTKREPLSKSQRGPHSPVNLLEANHLELIVTYTMGYTYEEIQDYLSELRSAEEQLARTMSGTRPTKGKLVRELRKLQLARDLETELWRIRQERVPMALSGSPGCDWRSFRDEATRFKRGAAELTRMHEQGSKKDAQFDAKKDREEKAKRDSELRKYWEPPKMPGLEVQEK